MKDFLNVIRRQVSEFLEKRSKGQKAFMGVAALVLIAAVAAVSVMLGKVNYEVLYSGLDEAEAGRIISVLEEKGIDAKAQGSGMILVPAEVADRVRMELAAEGYPESGLNYNIFSDISSFGKTDLEMRTYQQYQLQENLRDTIMMLDKIEGCVVIVNMSQDSLFVLSPDRKEASASVMLDIKNGGALTPGEAKSIGELVSKSVPDLKPENVRIVDTKMNLYSVTEESGTAYTLTQYELTTEVQSTLAEQVMKVLTPVFGEDNVSAAVNVVLNFDRETVSSVAFNPAIEGREEGLVLSMEELYEQTQSTGAAEGTAGGDSNGVGVSEYMYQDVDPGDFSKISRTINYELNQTQTQIEKAQGSIEQLSVAVLLNSEAYSGDYGEGVTELVARAIGVDEALVSVVSMPFQKDDGSADLKGLFDTQASLMDRLNRKEIITTAIIAFTVLLVLVFIIRFLRYTVDTARGRSLPAAAEGYFVNVAAPGGELAAGNEEEIPDIPDLSKPRDVERIERFVDKEPAAAAQLLRNWLMDDR